MTPTIPVIIPTFNNPTYLNSMLTQLTELGVERIIVIDNHSTTPTMLSLLDTLTNNIDVVKLSYNHGPRYCYETENYYRELPEYFCVTDPDLIFNESMPKTFLHELIDVSERFEIGKAGLALDISNPDKMRTDRILHNGKEYSIWDWEAQFWIDKIGETSNHDPIYSANVDTTFNLCNKRYFNRQNPNRAVRIAGRYTCKHAPWYKENFLHPLEEREYRDSQQHSWYFGGPKPLPRNSTLKERLKRNHLMIKRYGAAIWIGEKFTRWTGMSKSWKRIKLRMNLIDQS